MGKCGIPSLVEKGILTNEQILAAWKKHEKITGVAKELKINSLTAKRHLLRLGVPLTRRRGRPKGLRPRATGSVSRWLRKNTTAALPRSYQQIAAIVGCTPNAVKMFFKKRRNRIKKQIDNLPDLRKTSLSFKAPSGMIIPFRYVLDYDILFDKWTFKLRIIVRMKPEGKKKYIFRIKKIEDLISRMVSVNR